MSARTEYTINKDMNLKEYVEKENKDISVENKGDGTPLDKWEMKYDGYTFTIYDLKIQSYGKGVNPEASINYVTNEYVFEGKGNIEFKIDIKLPQEIEGSTVTITEPTGVTKEGENYTVNKNGEYTFKIIATKNGKEYETSLVANIDKILEKPTIEATDVKQTEFTIKVTNNYPKEANVEYIYYLGTTAQTEKISNTSKVISGLTIGTNYNVKVIAYISDEMYSESDILKTETRGIEIKTVEDLINIKNNMSGKYILMNDLNLSGISWGSIGGGATFYGTLDGNGYVIRNLKNSVQTVNQGGLFSKIQNATIKNLGIENVNISNCQQCGPIAGRVEGTSKISCCYTTGSMSNFHAAGIAYNLNNSSMIENCYSSITFTGKSNRRYCV